MDIPTGGLQNPAGEPPRLDGDSGRVSHDMETIFGSAALSKKGEGPSHYHAIVPIAAARQSHRRAARRKWAVSGLAITGAVLLSWGLAVGLQKADPPAPAPNPPATPLALPVRQAVTPPPVSQAPPRSPAGEDKRVPMPVATTVPATRDAERPSSPHKASKPVVAARPPRTEAGSACGRLARGALARCMRPQIISADRQLRIAYETAARAGVGRRTLVAYRQRWVRLRGQANADPRGVVIGYRQIARDLDAARTGRF